MDQSQRFCKKNSAHQTYCFIHFGLKDIRKIEKKARMMSSREGPSCLGSGGGFSLGGVSWLEGIGL